MFRLALVKKGTDTPMTTLSLFAAKLLKLAGSKLTLGEIDVLTGSITAWDDEADTALSPWPKKVGTFFRIMGVEVDYKTQRCLLFAIQDHGNNTTLTNALDKILASAEEPNQGFYVEEMLLIPKTGIYNTSSLFGGVPSLKIVEV